MYVMQFLSFYTIKIIEVTDMDHAELLDVLTSLPVSHAILPRVISFATSRLVNHAIWSYIDSSEYAPRPIRRCLLIAYIIKQNVYYLKCVFN